MKSTGVVRKIDPLSRVAFPIELRSTMNLNEGDPMEIFVDCDFVLLKNIKLHELV